jgi:hypothetical protein
MRPALAGMFGPSSGAAGDIQLFNTSMVVALASLVLFISDPHPTIFRGVPALSLNLAFFSQHTQRQLVPLRRDLELILSNCLQQFMLQQGCCTQQSTTKRDMFAAVCRAM